MSNRSRQLPGPVKSRLYGKPKFYLFGLALLLGLVAAGCARGSYPLDFFYEMHYQQSYKSHEPPRLSPPEGAVPWFPAPTSTSFTDGKHLFQVNCSICHGPTGKGDGPVLQTMKEKYGYQIIPSIPPDLTSPQVKGIGPGGIEGFMLSGAVVMPSFKKLLAPEERRLIAEYIVNCLQGARPQECP